MYAKSLEVLLIELCEKCDISPEHFADITQRFDVLRRNGQLPRGREKRDQLLTSREIAAAILGLICSRPGFAGVAAIILSNLLPVGGVGASFFAAATLGEAIERILTDENSRKALNELNVSLAEASINSSGYATLTYEIDGNRRCAFYVRREAVSLLQPGAEKNYEPGVRYSPFARDTTFNRIFFERIAHAIDMAKAFARPPIGDGSEYDAEEAEQKRFEKLEVRPGSRFLNIGVDNQVTWPQEETLVQFDTYRLVLMPKTVDHVQSIHVDLTTNKLSDKEAMTVVNRFLSVMTWYDDQFAVAQGGWSGNPVPVAVPKRDLAFATTSHWIFDRKIPSSEEARRAFALYREARNAQQNFLVSYAVLNFFKIIELRYDKNGAKRWFRDNLDILKTDHSHRDSFERFLSICGPESPHEYIYTACRIAVAHAGKHSKSDPDDANELTRLHTAAEVLRIFARHFIEQEFKSSEIRSSGE